MKKFIILVMSVAFLASSCNDWLNLKPKNKTVVGTLEDVKIMMSSYLLSLTSSSDDPITFNGVELRCPFNRDYIAHFAMYSDDIDMTQTIHSTYGKLYEEEYFEDVAWNGWKFASYMWKSLYQHVGFLNSALKSLDELSEYDQAEYERVRGEALTLRSFYLFRLVQLFAPYKNNELGIPMNLDPEVFQGIKRTPQAEVYRQILGDLTTALNYEAGSTSWNAFYSKNVIHAILAQVYQFKAGSAAAEESDWENAEKHAAYIVERYQLETRSEDYHETFYATQAKIYKNSPCALLKIAYAITPRSNTYAFWGLPTYQNSGQYPSQELRSSYDPNDIRITAYFADNNNYDKYEMYSDWETFFFLSDYTILFRIAEQYLICAEANARLGRAKGKELLDRFKQSRIPGYTTYPGTDVLDEIIREKRKEFCGEGEIRWMDMKRLGYGFTRKGLDEKTLEVKEYTLNPDDYRYTLPIPVDEELTYNNIPQNPGWN